MENPSLACTQIFTRHESGTLLIHLEGTCTLKEGIPLVSEVEKEIGTGAPVHRIIFETREVAQWDTWFVTYLIKIINLGNEHNIDHVFSLRIRCFQKLFIFMQN